MRLLLDSHVLLWYDSASIQRIADVQTIRSAEEIFVSAASFWELSIKHKRAKLFFNRSLQELLKDARFRQLAITAEHGIAAAELPDHHRDPFDRVLVAQASLEGLTLVTHDRTLLRYGTPVLLV